MDRLQSRGVQISLSNYISGSDLEKSSIPHSIDRESMQTACNVANSIELVGNMLVFRQNDKWYIKQPNKACGYMWYQMLTPFPALSTTLKL
jgi:hypothetical protein